MALTSADNIKTILKTYYKKNGVANLLFRNSPVLKKIGKERVEGKEQKFATLYGRGGAVAGDYLVAAANAADCAKTKEFAITPGQLFSVYTISNQEMIAAKTNAGAYMPIAGLKMFNCTEGFRKTLAMCLYGDGTGKINGVSVTGAGAVSVGDTDSWTFSSYDGIMAIDIGSRLVAKANGATADSSGVSYEVTAISGKTVSVKCTTAGTLTSGSTFGVYLKGSVDGNGKAYLPVGLAGWLPTSAPTSGDSFFGVDRSVAPDRLAGARYVAGSGEAKKVSLQGAIQVARRQGSQADLIIMNDEDFADFAASLETTNTFFTATTGKAKKTANVGMASATVAFSTNWIESIVDDPYCPKGTAYVLDMDVFKIWSYTDDPINKADKIADNNPGKENEAVAMEGKGKEYNLIADDYISVQPGTADANGPTSNVALQFVGQFVITNPSVCCVVTFA